ncbi:HAD family hydrolase [Paenibacillus hexagrammi]|uniref:Haloacid dehalogenase n=1 Tax=Paenibacillus hexagrammi TaxID=2908839 RepID=A0ABY3SQM7_9BACL|nr:haloacid dehalogenase [Paenibacillus sp. YPD9-1]UJF35773.1 haloacid dehalogenase [Paenibacillus sp. YPD9-1]
MLLRIPGQEDMVITDLVLDFNGTIAWDGKILPQVKERLEELSASITIHVLTADSNGSASIECESLPVKLQIIGKSNQREAKADFVSSLGSGVVAMGNGVNDELMFRRTDLSMAVIGKEGCATVTLLTSHIVVQDIADGLDLLLKHHRLIPTLRK